MPIRGTTFFSELRAAFFLSIALVSTPLTATPVSVVVEAACGAPEAVEVRAVAGDRRRTQVETIVFGAMGTATARIDLSPEEEWTLEARAPGFWSAPLPVKTANPTLSMWPAGTIEALASFSGDASSSGEASARLTWSPVDDQESPGECEPPAEGSSRCEWTTDRLRCPIPAGRWNLRYDLAGYAPVFRWEQEIPAGETTRLAPLAFHRGTSVLGRVDVQDAAGVELTDAKLELRPVVDVAHPTDRQEAQRRQRSYSGSANDWGYFQIDDVAAGLYELVATIEGFGSAVEGPLEMRPGESLELAPLEIRRHARLEVAVDPIEDPWKAPWQITLFQRRSAADLRVVANGETDAGLWTAPPLPPGEYLISVTERSSGDRYASTAVELADATQFVEIPIDFILVRGEVLRDDALLSSHLTFRRDSRQVEAPAPYGHFTVVLPTEGRWQVDVSALDGLVRSNALDVDVEADGDGRKAELVIDVPSTAVEGLVIDEEGQPVAAADVYLTAVTARPTSEIRSGADGRFEIAGLAPGSYFIRAESDERSSETLAVDLSEERPALGLRLVVQSPRSIQGRVVGSPGISPDAQVIAVGGGAAGVWGSWYTVTTLDAQGRFQIEAPAELRSVDLMVLAPGNAFFARRIAVPSADPIELTLSPPGGTVVLPRFDEPSLQSLLLIDGEPVTTPFLLDWALTVGGTETTTELIVPAMPSGRYEHCVLAIEELYAVLGGAAAPAPDACSSDYLSRGGTLHFAHDAATRAR